MDVYNFEFYKSRLYNWHCRSSNVIWHFFTKFIPKGYGGKWLDLGCGSGYYSKLLSKYLHVTPIGVDFSEKAKYLRCLSIPHQPLILADVSNLPIDSESIDGIFCSELLEHLQAPASALCEIHRVVRPGGYLFLTTTSFHHYFFHILVYFAYIDLIKHRAISRFLSRLYSYFIGCLKPDFRPQFMKYALERLDHEWGFTKKDLYKLLHYTGFKVKWNCYFNVKDIIPNPSCPVILSNFLMILFWPINTLFKVILRKTKLWGMNICIFAIKQTQ